MKPQELMIGNNVYFEFQHTGKSIVEITAKDLFEMSKANAKFLLYSEIPLTEDIFIKLGYTLRGSFFHIEGHAVWICSDMFVCDKNGVVLKYVHQLQNLYFATTGKNLIFKTPSNAK